MNLARAASAVVVAGAALGLAAPSYADDAGTAKPLADPNALGTYTFEGEDGESATWIVTPCVQDSLHCVNVAETGNEMRRPWNANAYWAVGSWTIFVDQPDAILCNDGGSEPGRNTYSWNADSLEGNVSIFNGAGACGSEPSVLNIPFALTKTGEPVRFPEAEPYVVDIPEPYTPPAAAEAPASDAMPAESDPALVATPEVFPSDTQPLTEAEVAEPGFNAGGGGGRR